MKIAALSDIHSNVFALEAVIQDAKQRGYDVMVNLGDILYGPIAPKATFELLMEHNLTTISGNQDRQIVEATPQEITDNATMGFIIDDLGTKPIQWMKQLPFDHQLTDDVYLCHGTPTNDLVYLLEDVALGYPQLRQNNKILTLIAEQTSKLILCGHTHIPRTVTLTTGQTIVNPGSVGLPAYTDDEPLVHSMETFSTHARYAMIEQGKDGWVIEHINVPYDVKSAVNASLQRGREDWQHFLSTGRKLSKKISS